MKTAIFGGTFDPPHSGHINIADKILEDGYADTILFMPALHPPHKLDVNYSSFTHRLEMLRAALKSFPKNKFQISILEQEFADKASFTYNTLEFLTLQNPSVEYELVIGADNLLTLHQWHNANELIKRWKILTYPRKGYDKLELLYNLWDKKTADKLSATMLPFDIFNVSSTEIREYIQNEKKKPDLITSPVYEYIKKYNLYKD